MTTPINQNQLPKFQPLPTMKTFQPISTITRSELQNINQFPTKPISQSINTPLGSVQPSQQQQQQQLQQPLPRISVSSVHLSAFETQPQGSLSSSSSLSSSIPLPSSKQSPLTPQQPQQLQQQQQQQQQRPSIVSLQSTSPTPISTSTQTNPPQRPTIQRQPIQTTSINAPTPMAGSKITTSSTRQQIGSNVAMKKVTAPQDNITASNASNASNAINGTGAGRAGLGGAVKTSTTTGTGMQSVTTRATSTAPAGRVPINAGVNRTGVTRPEVKK
jgi:hypothetical protein